MAAAAATAAARRLSKLSLSLSLSFSLCLWSLFSRRISIDRYFLLDNVNNNGDDEVENLWRRPHRCCCHSGNVKRPAICVTFHRQRDWRRQHQLLLWRRMSWVVKDDKRKKYFQDFTLHKTRRTAAKLEITIWRQIDVERKVEKVLVFGGKFKTKSSTRWRSFYPWEFSRSASSGLCLRLTREIWAWVGSLTNSFISRRRRRRSRQWRRQWPRRYQRSQRSRWCD